MKNLVVSFIIVVLASVSGMAQQVMQTYYQSEGEPLKEEFTVNKNGELDGSYTSFFKDGTIKATGLFKNNISTGEWNYFYPNAELRMAGNVVNGVNEGLWEYFYESGSRKMKGYLKEGKRDSLWVIYNITGSKQREGFYKENERVGIWKYYGASGGLQATEDIQEDYSEFTEYYISGEVKSKGKKFDGNQEGKWQYYFEDGALQAKGNFRAGKKNGAWKYYNEAGGISAEGDYINDLPDGIWVYYYESGGVSSKGKLYKGQKDGEWNLYYADGTLKGGGNYQLGNGVYKEYYKSGTLKVMGKVVNGRNQGKWEYFYESGVLEGTCEFRNGEGEFIGYYPPTKKKDIKANLTGNRKMKGYIQDNKKVGIWELYEENGELAGYYKPYYEGENEGFTLANDTKEQIELSARKRAVRIGSYSYSKHKSKYFKSKINEHRAYIVNYNPIAVFYNMFPMGVEYYMSERLGYEALFQYLRNPFLKDFNSLEDGKTYSEGFSASVRQKFYQRETDFGVPYFAHELRYTYLQHSTNINQKPVLGAYESKYEYAILVGVRYFKNKQENGFTIDVFLGAAAGYRDFHQTYFSTNRIADPFSNLNSNILSLSLRAGFHLGYTFKTRKF